MVAVGWRFIAARLIVTVWSDRRVPEVDVSLELSFLTILLLNLETWFFEPPNTLHEGIKEK